jgi:hypothetical protein
MRMTLLLLLVAPIGFMTGADGQERRPPMLSCQPRNLRPQQTLVLRFAAGHPAELAVHSPDGTSLFLVYDRDDSLGPELQPIVGKDVFRRMRELRLPVSTASGSPWVAGRDKNELIFSKRGRYEFILTEVLESDAGFPQFLCTVNFVP